MGVHRLLYCCLAIAAILAVAAIDYDRANASWQIDVPPCPNPPTQACLDRYFGQVQVASGQNDPVEEGFRQREWLYAAGILIVVLVTLRSALRAEPRERRRQIFRELGVVGVVLGVIAVLIKSAPDPTDLGLGTPALWLLPMGVVATAAIGGVKSLPSGAPQSMTVSLGRTPGSAFSRMPRAAQATLIVTALTVVLVIVYRLIERCSIGGAGLPDWAGALPFAITLIATAGVALGFLTLLTRRWFVGALGVFVNPMAWISLLAPPDCS